MSATGGRHISRSTRGGPLRPHREGRLAADDVFPLNFRQPRGGSARGLQRDLRQAPRPPPRRRAHGDLGPARPGQTEAQYPGPRPAALPPVRRTAAGHRGVNDRDVIERILDGPQLVSVNAATSCFLGDDKSSRESSTVPTVAHLPARSEHRADDSTLLNLAGSFETVRFETGSNPTLSAIAVASGTGAGRVRGGRPAVATANLADRRFAAGAARSSLR